jgi:hypothetical protein
VDRSPLVKTVLSVAQRSSWTWWIVLGVVIQVLLGLVSSPPPLVDVGFRTIGALMIAVGSAGIGREVGKIGSDELLRSRLMPTYRRTFRLYDAFIRLAVDVERRRGDLPAAGSTVPRHVQATSLEVIYTLVDAELSDYQNAIAEWEALLPEETAKLQMEAQSVAVSEPDE